MLSHLTSDHHPERLEESLVLNERLLDTQVQDAHSNGRPPNDDALLSSDKLQSHHPHHLALDLLRGLIIVLMAWDHVAYQFTNERDAISKTESESWEGPYSTYDNSPKKFLIRSVSHISAPGFFLTMGISMVLFTASRRELLHWSWLRITAHHCLRGVLFLFVDYLFDFPGVLPQLVDLNHGRVVKDSHGNQYTKGDEGKVLFHALFATYQVMTALGLSMILGSLILPFMFFLDYMKRGFGEILGWIGFLSFFAVSNVAIVIGQGDENLDKPPKEYPHKFFVVHDADHLLGRVLLYPGHLFKNWEMITYPVIPWIGIVILGMGYGLALRADPIRLHRKLRWMSVTLLAAFCCIRAFGGKLNYRGRQRGEEIRTSAWIAFLTQTKYPPDLAFACITLSVLFLFISLFNHSLFLSLENVIEGGDEFDTEEQANAEERRDAKFLLCAFRKRKCQHILLYPLVLFGRTPLFFYVAHKWIIQIVEAVCRIPNEPIGRFSTEIVIFVWLVLLILMFEACRRFNRFRTCKNRSSWWRLL